MKDFSHPCGDAFYAYDLNKAIESALTVSRNEWKYAADVTTELDPNLPPITCLPGDINQVLLNLIVNAAHAIVEKNGETSCRKGRIGITTRFDDPWAEIRISDDGAGIPESIRSRVFDPFFTTKEVGRGTGQGLAIVHSVIAEKHRGTITFESHVGRGTTFIVRLPVHREPLGGV
jgi:signal transduction histidine kinase